MTARLGHASLTVLFHRRLYELLHDGQWHDLEPVLADLARIVPPGLAMREAEKSRRGSSRYDGKGNRKDPAEVGPRAKYRTPEELQRIGARRIVFAVTAKNKGDRGPYEQREVDGVRQLRMTRKSKFIKGDEALAEVLRPPFSTLAATFTQQGQAEAARLVQLTAHEYGIHLSSCPKGCSLLQLVDRRREPLQADGGE